MRPSPFILIIPVLLILALTLTGCRGNRGCTDPEAVNYDPYAERDDRSCEYEGSLVFWFGQTASEALVDDGAISLTYWLDGELVGSSATSVYWSGPPECGANASVTVNKNIGRRKSAIYRFEVIDQDDWIYWSGDIEIAANICMQLQLLWSERKKK